MFSSAPISILIPSRFVDVDSLCTSGQSISVDVLRWGTHGSVLVLPPETQSKLVVDIDTFTEAVFTLNRCCVTTSQGSGKKIMEI